MTLNGIAFTRTKNRLNERWYWRTNPSANEIIAGVMPRRATAAEARQLNRMIANDPPTMTLPGVHPSYRA